MIRDVGSMHGTRLNDQSLQPQQDTAINQGDVVEFGLEVRRGPETFPACRFSVDWETGFFKYAKAFMFWRESDLQPVVPLPTIRSNFLKTLMSRLRTMIVKILMWISVHPSRIIH